MAKAATVKNSGVTVRPFSMLRTVSTEIPALRATASAERPEVRRAWVKWEASACPRSWVARSSLLRGMGVTIPV